jgi:hypothetical protein
MEPDGFSELDDREKASSDDQGGIGHDQEAPELIILHIEWPERCHARSSTLLAAPSGAQVW